MRLTRKELSTMKRWTMALIGVLFCLAMPMAFMACTAGAELEMEKARLVAERDTTDDQFERDYLTKRIESIENAMQAAEKQATEDATAAKDAAMLIPGGAAFAGLVFAGVKYASKSRNLAAIVKAIQAARQASPAFEEAFKASKPVIAAAMGESASKAVKKIKAKTKGA